MHFLSSCPWRAEKQYDEKHVLMGLGGGGNSRLEGAEGEDSMTLGNIASRLSESAPVS